MLLQDAFDDLSNDISCLLAPFASFLRHELQNRYVCEYFSRKHTGRGRMCMHDAPEPPVCDRLDIRFQDEEDARKVPDGREKRGDGIVET